MKIDAYYDILCPFSFLAKRALELALDERDAADVAIELHPFMLHPTLPLAGPHSFRGAFTAKYGEGKRVSMWDRVIGLGKEVGIDFAFYRIEQGAHAVHGHRAVHFAKRHGRERDMLEAIYRAFYEQARYIGDAATLAELGESVGLPRAELLAYLESGDDVELMFALTERYRIDPGISGMPFHLVDGRPTEPQGVAGWRAVLDGRTVAAAA